MPFSVDIYNASYFLQMESDPYGIHISDSGIGVPLANRTFSSSRNSRFAPLLSTVRDNRIIDLPLQMTGTSMDDWVINSQQLRAVLRGAELYNSPENYGEQGARAYIALQMPNATNTTVWEIICGDLEEGQVFQSVMSIPYMPVAMLRLYCHTWGHPQQIVRVTSPTLDVGQDFFVLTAPQGEREAPARVTMQTAAGSVFRRVIVAKRSRGNVNNIKWVFECETGTYTGYVTASVETSGNFALSNVADAAASNGNVLRMTHTATGTDGLADLISITINDNLEDYRGRWKVFLLAATSTSNWTAARQSFGGTTGLAVPGGTVSSPFNADDAAYLGEIDIPYPYVPPGGGSNPSFVFVLEASFNSAVFTIDWDCVFLVPCDEQYAEIELTDAASVAEDQMIWDNLSIPAWTYLLDSAGNVKSDRFTYGQNTRFTVVPPHDNAFFCLFAEDFASGAARRLKDLFLDNDCVLIIDYLPQYELLS